MRLLIERITAVNTAPAIAAFISFLIVLNILSYLILICFFILHLWSIVFVLSHLRILHSQGYTPDYSYAVVVFPANRHCLQC
jgi:hypothetical protein